MLKRISVKKKLLALVSLACLLFYSSYSLAYDQQYQVGSTGPNGGTVTSVTVNSTLLNTTEKQVGDFLEKTYEYKYTESVTETITTTQTSTTTTYETVEKSTGDIINNTTLSNGTVTCTSSGSGIYLDNCANHTMNWDDMHGQQGSGSYTFSTNINEWLTKDELNYGFSATASAQAYSSTSSAYFTIRVTLTDPTTGASTYSTNQWLVPLNTWTTYSNTLTVGTNSYSDSSTLSAQFLHNDLNGYMWSGDYQNFNLGITYNELTAVLTTIETQIQSSIQSAIDTLESQVTKTYNPIAPATNTTTVETKIEEPKAIEIKLETADMSMKFDVKVETTDQGTVQVSMSNGGTITEIAEIKPITEIKSIEPSGGTQSPTETKTVEISMPKTTSTPKVEAKTETKTETAKSESKSENKEEAKKENKDKEDSKEEKTATTVAEAKQKVADKIIQQVVAGADAIVINDTKIALMVALADTENFNKYLAAKNKDLEVWYLSKEIYGDKEYVDKYSILYNLANDKLHKELTDLQYDYKYQENSKLKIK